MALIDQLVTESSELAGIASELAGMEGEECWADLQQLKSFQEVG